MLSSAHDDADGGHGANLGGTWHGSGTDQNGTTWVWKLTLEHEHNNLKGAFNFTGSRGQLGTEYVRGEFDPDARTFILKGSHAEGDVVPTSYFGSVGKDFVSLVGHWSSSTGYPGVIIGGKR